MQENERFDRFSNLVVETWQRTERDKVGTTARTGGGGRRNKMGE